MKINFFLSRYTFLIKVKVHLVGNGFSSVDHHTCTAGSSVRENFSVKLYRVKECTSEHLDSIFRCTVPHNGSAEPIKSEIGRVVQ